MSLPGRDFTAGQRLSLKGQLCTVRYVGLVRDKSGEWLGLEWDDTTRGKHNGSHDGIFYFKCRSKSPTCASFIRPNQSWDTPRTFLQAVRQKYMPDFREGENENVYFSGKQAEEIGFQKFHDRQAKLKGIRVLVVDGMCVQHRNPSHEDDAAVAQICADITELDLSRNLFETFAEIGQLCHLLPKLKVLTLDGNKFDCEELISLSAIKTLNLENTLLAESQIDTLLRTATPRVQHVSLANNGFASFLNLRLSSNVTTMDLSGNEFTCLSDVQGLSADPSRLESLILKRNRISAVTNAAETTLSLSVSELDLSYNEIRTFSFIDALKPVSMPSLRHLRLTGNPLYKSLTSAEGKSLIAADGYMLTIARLPQLEYFNYSQITDKERLNAETYYLSQIAIEIGNSPEDRIQEVISRHWRYNDLCVEYGEPNTTRQARKDTVNPNTWTARLIAVTFIIKPGTLPGRLERSWIEHIPKAFTIYAVLGLVSKRLQQTPLCIRLILETSEQDPVAAREAYTGPEWWDSSDEEMENQQDWSLREVELVSSTRALATYIEGDHAKIRVDIQADRA